MAIHDQAAEREFVDTWEPHLIRWASAHAPRDRVDDYVQEVWEHLFNRDWKNLLRWKALFNDDEWHEHSLKSFLKTITVNKVTDLQRRAYLRRLKYLDPADILLPSPETVGRTGPATSSSSCGVGSVPGSRLVSWNRSVPSASMR